MIKTIFALSLAVALSACLAQEPGVECLNSFRSTLKDPESGKVISFTAPILTYTATNSYGGRLQGKALCIEIEGKWQRNKKAEYEVVLEQTVKAMKSYNACRDAGSTNVKCAGDSAAFLGVSQSGVDIERLQREIEKELGF